MGMIKLKNTYFNGSWINNVKQIFNKLNEFIDYSNGIGLVDGGSYKSYIVLLSQTSTDAPTAKILINTIGSITWSYVSTGVYTATLTNAFTADKTFILLNSVDTTQIYGYAAIRTGVNTISFTNGTLGGNTPADGILVNFPIEIRVYN